MNTQKKTFIFFGSSRLSVIVLDELSRLGLTPSLIITTANKPVGRSQTITPNIVKQWATEKKIPCLSPEKLDEEFVAALKKEMKKLNGTGVYGDGASVSETGTKQAGKGEVVSGAINGSANNGAEANLLFLVASFGKIIPNEIVNLPSKGTLNIHPSLLPKYRGPSPLPSVMLADDKQTGITIMKMDKEMDHGPIIAQKNITVTEWPTYEDFEEMMAKEGAELFAEILPKWLANEIKPVEQDHSVATYTKKITKADGLIDLASDPYMNFRKIQAFHEWPKAYFFLKHNGRDIRVKVTEATYEDGKLIVKKVIPEGAKEMAYEDFERGYVKL